MILRSLDIRSFRCIRQLHVDFAEGLNVLYGPNELGKSTLVEALRAAFLLPVNSKVAEDFVPWGTDETPQVMVEFELPNRGKPESAETELTSTRWRIKKSFGHGSGASALLERVTGHGRGVKDARGRDVEGQLRSLLDWGIQEPGGRGAPRGWPQSYLVTALLGEQDGVAKIFETSLDSDGTDSGRNRLTTALGVLAQAPEVTALLDRLSLRTREVFTEKGQKRRTQESPLAWLTEQKRKQQATVEKLEHEELRSKTIEEEILSLRQRQQQADESVALLNREVELLTAMIRKQESVRDCENRNARLKNAIDSYEKIDEQFRKTNSQRQQLQQQLQAAEKSLGQAKATLASHEARLKQLADSRSESLESRRQQLEAARKTAQQRASNAQRVLDATSAVDQLRKVVTDAIQKSEEARNNRRKAECALRQALQKNIEQAEKQVAHAESVTKLARLKTQRDQLNGLMATVASAEQEFQRFSDATKQAETQLEDLKSERTKLENTRRGSLDAEKQAWEQRQKQAAHRRQLEDDYRKAETTELSARNYLNDIDRFDDVYQRLSETKQKQIGLKAERDASEQQLSQLTDELGRVTRSVSLWQMTAIGCAVSALLTLVLAIVIASGRVFLFSGSSVLGILFIVLVLRWRQFSHRRHKVSAERETIRHTLDRLASQALITDSELAAAQREFETCQRSLPNELVERLGNLTDTRSWLEEKLPRAIEKRSRLEQQIAALDQHDAAPAPEADHDDRAAALDAHIQELDEQITDSEDAAKAARTQRDQAQARYEQAQKAASAGDSGNDGGSESRLQLLDSQIVVCIEQLNRPENHPIPNVEEAAHEESLARRKLIIATSAYDSRAESLSTEGQSDSNGEELGEEPADMSVEDAEQQLRLARGQVNEAEDELKQQQATMRAKEATAAQLAKDLEKPSDEALNDANQALTDIVAQIADLDTGADSNIESATAERDAAQIAELQQQEQVAALKNTLEEIDDEVTKLQEAREDAKTSRDKAEENARQLDTDSTKAELLSLEQTLACEFPALEISADKLKSSTKRRDAALEEQNQISKSLHEARGKLELSGGEVLREKLETAQEELDRIEAEAIEQELEYDALYHLLQILQHASQLHSAHLGNSLARPVTEQFCALTGNRYAALQLDPDLQLKTVTSLNSERPRDAMSVGTRHQLATLIRLALAAHLQTTVVLDDQLVHSDTNRLLWFRDRLRHAVAENEFQAVVVTCRPLDYISEQELRSGSDSHNAGTYGACISVNLAASMG